MVAQARALAAAITFLPRQGTSTRFATGSQISPIMLCSASDAAVSACSREPPARVTMPAAAIAAAEPPSAWQPPTSAANDHGVQINTPINPAAKSARAIASSSSCIDSATVITAAGKAAQAPAVGAATITPIELFTSMSAVVASTIRLSRGSPTSRPAASAAAKPGACAGSTRSAYSVPAMPEAIECFRSRTICTIRSITSRSVKPPRAIS